MSESQSRLLEQLIAIARSAGEIDLYPRLGRTMEWDIAAGHAVLAAAGGRVTTLDGLDNPHFVASGLAAE